MKLFLSALYLLVAIAVRAQSELTITNNVKVTLSTNSDNALRLAWKLENNARTNGLAPYTSITNALTYPQYQDWLATEAFVSIAKVKADENLMRVIQLYRTSSDADQARVARILAGLSN